VELSSAGAVNYSKTIGNTTNQEEFHDLIETTSNDYLLLASWCSNLTACSGGLVEISNTTQTANFRKTFESNPTGTVFSPYCIYRTPDNNNYWIGGQITNGLNGGSGNDCLMIKTSAATPAPASGYAIGDNDDNNFTLTAGAASGNDEFILGGTENLSGAEWRSTVVKGQSAPW
jgi:hypothetical protein